MICRRSSKTLIALIALAAAAILPAPGADAYGQSLGASGTIQGVVADPTGAVMESATVEINNWFPATRGPPQPTNRGGSPS